MTMTLPWRSLLLAPLALALAAWLPGLPAPAARAATMSVETSAAAGLDPRKPMQVHRLRLTGPIEPGDSDRIATTLRSLRARTPRVGDLPLATLELAGQGGDLLEGIRIGSLLREYDIATVVRAGDTCLSACALIFLGGTSSHAWPAALPSRSLEIGARLGFHTFTLNTGALQNSAREARSDTSTRAFALARQGAALMMRYALDMGVDPGFFATLIGQPPETWTWIETAGQFIQLGIAPQGAVPPPGSLVEQVANLCNHATGWQVGVRPAHVRPVATLPPRPVSGPVSAPGPDSAAATAGLTLRGGGRTAKPDPATAAVPTIAHFDVTAPSTDSFMMRCQVTLSTVDPDAFEVSLATSGGLLRSYTLPPVVNPGLLRYHVDDVLNPRR